MSNIKSKQVFSKNLRYYVSITGKDRGEVAKDLSVPYSTFNDWYNGNVYPRIDTINKLCEYFNIRKSDLQEEKDILIDDIDKGSLLTMYISNLCNSEIEKEILIKVTMLNEDNIHKVLEIVNLYLKEQGDYYIKDKDKWADSSDNKEHYKKEYDEMMKEINKK